jgi:hypothetical protein
MRKTLPLLLSCVGLLVLALPASAMAKAVNFGGATPDASAVFFTDDSQLVPADTDTLTDVYERSGGVTTLISVPGVGASGAPATAAFQAVSADGTKVIFVTTENLVAADTDGLNDVYERSGGTTTLVSAPGLGSSGAPGSMQFRKISSDGSKVFFETGENLVTADTDGSNDVYERSAGTTTLVSAPGVGASGPVGGSQLLRISSDGSKAFFSTSENFVAADTDGLSDLYERSGGTTSLVSAREAGGSGPDVVPGLGDISTDGSKVFFTTAENMVAADTDGLRDVYERSGGVTTLLSQPGAGATPPDANADFQGSTPDGSKVFFETHENLVTADTDGLQDVYERSGGVTTLLSVEGSGAFGPLQDVNFVGTSDDGNTVFMDTDESFVGADIDTVFDIYKRAGGTTTLVSPDGSGASGPSEDANFWTNSPDGATVIFDSDGKMVGADTDGARDIYASNAGTTTLVSAPGAGGIPSSVNAAFRRASTDASRVIFGTGERLTGADPDTAQDLYERSAGTTTLLSGEPGPPLGVAPDTTIASGPSSVTEGTGATFNFTSSETPATFECRTDSAAFTPCGSSLTFTAAGPGAHILEVRSADFSGNVDATPATQPFTVVAAPVIAPTPTPTPTPKHCKKGQKLKKGKCVKKKHRK